MANDILFNLNDFDSREIELAQLANANDPAGQVETITGQVNARRLSGKVLSLSESDNIYMGDTLEVSDDGSLGIIFADDTIVLDGASFGFSSASFTAADFQAISTPYDGTIATA